MLKNQKIPEFSEQRNTFNRISNLLEYIFLLFNLQKEKVLKINKQKINGIDVEFASLLQKQLSTNLFDTLKTILKTINFETSFKKMLFFRKKRRNQFKNYLFLNE